MLETLIQKLWGRFNKAYQYDSNGNIINIYETATSGNRTQTFTYDYRGFLTNEFDGTLEMYYTYDNNGNITTKQSYDGTTNIIMGYDNGPNGIYHDRLIAYGAKQIKYDDKFFANPQYFGTFNSQGELTSGITYGWEGKNLTYYHNSETQQEIIYAYNDQNLRISKTINNVITTYTYEGSCLVMKQSGSKIKRYTYDETGLLLGFSYHHNALFQRFYYIRDQLAHIIGFVNELGEVCIR